MKKKLTILSLIFLSSLLSLGGCQKQNDKTSDKPFVVDEFYIEEALPSPSSTIVKEEEVEQEEYDFHTPLQAAYLESSYDKISSFAKGTKELSKPRYLSFEAPEGTNSCIVYESDNKKSRAAAELNDDNSFAELTNLKADTSYTLQFADPNKTTVNFKTASSLPRNLDVEGVTNVRDIGGYPSKLGGKIRQGLYYRGGRFNYSDEETTIDEPSTFKNEITEEGYEVIVHTLGIKNEIDLRMNESHYTTTYAHEYGMMDNSTYPDIEYVPFPLNWNFTNMMKDEKETIGQIFKFLANEDNYPLYIHCNIGTDRTGMITYILGCLLGIEQENLYYDYLFSNFANINGSRDLTKIINLYQKTLLDYNDDNLHLDACDYLADCGVNEREINNILKIFIAL